MRKYATSWLIKVLLGAIVVVFVLWGVGSYKSQKTTRIALVNGETITLEEYKQTYSNLIEQLRLQFGERGFLQPIWLGLILIGIGLIGTSRHNWEMMIWGVLTLIGLIIFIGLMRKSFG